MQVTTEQKNPHTVSVTVRESAKEMERHREHVIDHLRAHANIKGFRPGADIPREVIEKNYSAETIERELVEHYLNECYAKIIAKSGVAPVAAGEIQEIKSVTPLDVTFDVEVLPPVEFDVKKLEKIKLKRDPLVADENDVDLAIAEIEKRFTKFVAKADEKAKIEQGDRVSIDAQGYEEKGGTAIPETQVRGFDLVIGSGQFIPGFEEKLVGHAKDETVGFDITFPADYHSDAFKGRKVYFEVEIHGIEAAQKPEWNAEFIKGLRGVETDMDGFRAIIRDEIKAERERAARAKDEEKLLDELLAIATVAPGPRLIELETDKLYGEQASRLQSQGIDMKTYLAHVAKSEEEYKAEIIRPEATRRLSAELILKKLQDDRASTASDEEVNVEVQSILKDYQNPVVRERLIAKLVPGDGHYEDIRTRLAYRKVIDSFFTAA